MTKFCQNIQIHENQTATDLSKPLLNHDFLISAYASNNKQITVRENIFLITFKF